MSEEIPPSENHNNARNNTSAFTHGKKTTLEIIFFQNEELFIKLDELDE